MAVDSGEESHSFHTVMILPEGMTNTQCDPPRPNMAYMEVPNLLKSETYLSCEPSLLNGIKLKVDKLKNYVPHITGVDIEKGKAGDAKFTEESLTNLKSENSKERSLFIDLCSQIGGKFTQLLMNHGTELPKFTYRDRRKYKRSSSFNSRRVVLLSSVMSIMGTIILIYLTLRVRQFGDGHGNVDEAFNSTLSE